MKVHVAHLLWDGDLRRGVLDAVPSVEKWVACRSRIVDPSGG